MAPISGKNANGKVRCTSLETANAGLAENATENVVALGTSERPVVALGGIEPVMPFVRSSMESWRYFMIPSSVWKLA